MTRKDKKNPKGKVKTQNNKAKSSILWTLLGIGTLVAFVIIVVALSGKGSHIPSSFTPADNIDKMWSEELDKHLGGCNIATESAWNVQWYDGTGGIVNSSYSSEQACVRVEGIHFGLQNSAQQLSVLIRKEANVIDSNVLMYDQLNWGEIVDFVNPNGLYEVDVLGDFIAYRMLSSEDQQVLWQMRQGDFGYNKWDRNIDCELLREANNASTMVPNATIQGGIPNLLANQNC